MHIYLKGITASITFTVYDVLGKQVFAIIVKPSDLHSDAYQLNMLDYKSGAYLFRLQSKVIQKSFKVMKL